MLNKVWTSVVRGNKTTVSLSVSAPAVHLSTALLPSLGQILSTQSSRLPLPKTGPLRVRGPYETYRQQQSYRLSRRKVGYGG
jgi:hypothetical protein